MVDSTNFSVSSNATVPIGAIIPFLKSLTGAPDVPSGFVECNGQEISDVESPFNEVTIPDLNGDGRVLYGNATSGSIKTEDFMPSHSHAVGTLKFKTADTAFDSVADCTNTGSFVGAIAGSTATSTAGTAWVGYSVVWILRIK